MLRSVALVRTDVSEDLAPPSSGWQESAELVTAKTLFLVHRYLSPWWWRRYVLPKCRFLQEPHGVTSKKTTFFNWILNHRERVYVATVTGHESSLCHAHSVHGLSPCLFTELRWYNCRGKVTGHLAVSDTTLTLACKGQQTPTFTAFILMCITPWPLVHKQTIPIERPPLVSKMWCQH
jgi:hypothetical protein